MKIALYYDTLVDKGGAERMTIELANGLDADIITAGFDEKVRRWLPIKTNVINLGNFSLRFSKPIGTLFEAPLRFFLNARRFTGQYDVHIFSGFSSIYGADSGNKNIWYCLTPNRMLYDLRENKLAHSNLLARFVFFVYIYFFSLFDYKVVKANFRKIVVQTKTVGDRLKKYYQSEYEQIYAPVRVSNFKFNSFGDYYLTVSRLYIEKRVDLIVKSFQEMPGKKLVIVGDGPEKAKIIDLTKNYPNITYIDSCDEEKLIDLYANCLATVYMPLNEDFGLISLESMASGKVCIGANEGGLKETIIDGETGFLIRAEKEALKEVVQNFSVEKAEEMKESCLKQAKKFDIDYCILKWKEVINKL